MGLLDEAIREHLELKRRQGADPGEIARKEREALEPVLPDEPATWGEEPVAGLGETFEEHAARLSSEPPAEVDATPHAREGIDLSTVGQETAEIDMSEVLGIDGYEPPAAYPIVPADPVRAGRIIEQDAQSHPEWEIAGRAGGEAVHEIPGQERLTFE
jgi:hypothetical protein